ncbi:MAG: helix-turn-helix domain-containing protein [Candidatus Fimadaptatus sp.]
MADRISRKTNSSYIAARRKQLGISQIELARSIGCGHNQISRWEKGANCPGGRYLIQLAQALDCDPSDILADYQEGGA